LPGTKRGRLRFRSEEIDAALEAWETGATDRGGDSHHDGRAQDGAYDGLSSEVTATAPPEAATTEEDT
jgi:hypothetical protein